MKKAIIIFSIILTTLCIYIYIIVNHFDKAVKFNGQNYIAHAGGSIDNVIYTNSLEAIEKSIKDGYKYIELDLHLTTDNKLVAYHPGYEDNDNFTYQEFMNHKIKGKYTPIDYKIIDSIFSNNKDLYLVTDKISNPEILLKYFHNFKDRIIVEAFSKEDYYNLCQENIACFFSMNTSFKKLFLQRIICKPISNIVTDQNYFNECFQKFKTEKFFYKINNLDLSLFSVNTKQEADSIFNLYPNCKFVYVNNL